MKTKRIKACVVEALFRTSFCTNTSTRFCTECGLALMSRVKNRTRSDAGKRGNLKMSCTFVVNVRTMHCCPGKDGVHMCSCNVRSYIDLRFDEHEQVTKICKRKA